MIMMRTDYGVVTFDYTPSMTVAQALQATLDTAEMELRIPEWQIQETHTGRVLNPVELVVDGRYYHLTAFLRRRPAFRRR